MTRHRPRIPGGSPPEPPAVERVPEENTYYLCEQADVSTSYLFTGKKGRIFFGTHCPYCVNVEERLPRYARWHLDFPPSPDQDCPHIFHECTLHEGAPSHSLYCQKHGTLALYCAKCGVLHATFQIADRYDRDQRSPKTEEVRPRTTTKEM